MRTGEKPWRRPAAVAALLLTALLAAASARADDPAAHRSEAQQLRARSDGLTTQAQQAVLDLYALESRLARAERRLASLLERQADLKRREASERRQLAIARSDLVEAERHLASRLQALYVEGEVDPLAVLLGAESLGDALSALDGLGRVAEQDGAILQQVARARTALRTSLRSLQGRRSELRQLVADASEERSALSSARAERAAYLAELQGRQAFNDRLLARVSARAAAAEETAVELVAPGGGGAAPAPPPSAPSAPGTQMTVLSTGYCLRGTTATGVPTGWGVVAVDPAVIPLGTKMLVPGYGDGVAADTGSAVRGAMIDLWFPTCSQALAWGKKTIVITIL